ncbi:hypothetical protein GCM10011360_31280 [Primorskyibacter flagellatus]|uniref:Hedgehog/Intein (Hint) domain-containing protein n=1 Tax=Primorskyibacter flagellatus TaxID=1387277 RepID=A0A917EJ31_9RHOB|nr:Hint domain-containing protein [Primorskyibacter flagellatus]GGE41526.1 hypothetical protein GCM10011360_31280 [Primorskyibacter flagellatus]
MGSAIIDVEPYLGALTVLDLLSAGQTIVLGQFGTPESHTITDVDGILGPGDDGIATLSGQPITYVGSGTATPGVAVPGVGTVPLGSPSDLVVFQAGGTTYFHYPDGPPDLTGAVAVVIDIDATPYPLFTPVCFTADAMISVPGGECPAGDLREGDLIEDAEGNAHAILWTCRRQVSLSSCGPRARERLAPVVIPAGAFGPGRPSRDLRLSQQHLVRIRHVLAALYFADDTILLPARALIGRQARLDLEAEHVTYVHIMTERHVVLRANGLATETFLPGPQALAAMTPGQRIAFRADRHRTDIARRMVPAGRILSVRDGRFLSREIIGPIRRAANSPRRIKRMPGGLPRPTHPGNEKSLPA